MPLWGNIVQSTVTQTYNFGAGPSVINCTFTQPVVFDTATPHVVLALLESWQDTTTTTYTVADNQSHSWFEVTNVPPNASYVAIATLGAISVVSATKAGAGDLAIRIIEFDGVTDDPNIYLNSRDQRSYFLSQALPDEYVVGSQLKWDGACGTPVNLSDSIVSFTFDSQGIQHFIHGEAYYLDPYGTWSGAHIWFTNYLIFPGALPVSIVRVGFSHVHGDDNPITEYIPRVKYWCQHIEGTSTVDSINHNKPVMNRGEGYTISRPIHRTNTNDVQAIGRGGKGHILGVYEGDRIIETSLPYKVQQNHVLVCGMSADEVGADYDIWDGYGNEYNLIGIYGSSTVGPTDMTTYMWYTVVEHLPPVGQVFRVQAAFGGTGPPAGAGGAPSLWALELPNRITGFEFARQEDAVLVAPGFDEFQTEYKYAQGDSYAVAILTKKSAAPFNQPWPHTFTIPAEWNHGATHPYASGLNEILTQASRVGVGTIFWQRVQDPGLLRATGISESGGGGIVMAILTQFGWRVYEA